LVSQRDCFGNDKISFVNKTDTESNTTLNELGKLFQGIESISLLR